MSPRQKLQLIKLSIGGLIAILVIVNFVIYFILNSYVDDFNRISEIKQIQAGLAEYNSDLNYYPPVKEPRLLSDLYSNSQKLCEEGFKRLSDICQYEYLPKVPDNLFAKGNYYYYQDTNESSAYKIEFTLKHNFKYLNLVKGKNCASPGQIIGGSCF